MTHAPTIRRLFDMQHAFRPRPPLPADLPRRARPGPGQITLITGPSGGGKSSLLATMRPASGAAAAGSAASGEDGRTETEWIDPSRIRLDDACVIDCVCRVLGDGEDCVERALELLGRVGLAEAWTYLQKPGELSDGQRWRLMLAMAVATADTVSTRPGGGAVTAVLAMDEFAALLDRITARVVARALRRLIRPVGPGGRRAAASEVRPALSAVVATSHDDLIDALRPDIVVTCDFDDYVLTTAREMSSREPHEDRIM